MSNQVNDVKIEIGEDLASIKPIIFNSNSLYQMDDILYYYRENMQSATRSKKVFLWNGPELIGKHIEKKIDMNSYNMKEQLNRVITHQLFLVVKSQFNRKEKYVTIKNNILMNLNNEYYKDAVSKCKYSIKYLKGILAKICLKYKLVFLMYIISKIY